MQKLTKFNRDELERAANLLLERETPTEADLESVAAQLWALTGRPASA